MATRISLAELNAVGVIAHQRTDPEIRILLADMIGEISRWRKKARKLGQYAARIRNVQRAQNLAHQLEPRHGRKISIG